MKKLLLALHFIFLGVAFSACNIINPDEPIPTYIRIDSFNVVATDINKHGSVSKNISDVWVYVNNQNVGTFELPATIPVLMEGDSVDISLYAGIKVNGQSFYRRRYIFYTPYSQRLGKKVGETQTIIPHIEYRTTANFLLNETFENGNSFKKYLDPDTTLERTNVAPYVFEGNYAGLIYLKDTVRGARVITTQEFSLPGNKESFMEMDYKCDVPFTLEVQLVTLGNTVLLSDVLSINARSTWNKIYINLTDIGVGYAGSKANFILRASLPTGQNEGFVAIDNFKIITQ